MVTERDYDANPERFRAGSRITAAYLRPGPTLYEKIARVIAERRAARVLDLGCGDGAFGAAVCMLPDPPWVVGLDAAAALLSTVPGPVVLADVTAIPFADKVFDAVVAVNVFDHLPDPAVAVRAAHRVLRPGGALIAGAISRRDSPELAAVWRPAPTPFDAEEAPGIVGSVFAHVTVDNWDAPLLTLPDAAAIADYLIVRFVPPDQAVAKAHELPAPLVVTKRGTLVIASDSRATHRTGRDANQA
ncbi:class I SAM-dependent methyltransferase [Nocardia altamirensis]|uniref:class I SAM-dependent methyltransferase n=1 Tax=Nocardia altamirensis TaxID=472158 RepID=UPI00084033A5|nr:class I SAM-dependent methyltransferase [Nocardia altamirensis]